MRRLKTEDGVGIGVAPEHQRFCLKCTAEVMATYVTSCNAFWCQPGRHWFDFDQVSSEVVQIGQKSGAC
jgi:hypothetical protein